MATEVKADPAKRFTLARKEKQNADIIRKQNLARIFLLSALNEDVEHEDMSVALQDGVLLCKLINHYKPDSIKKYNINPKTPFKMMENAAFVLDFCKKNAIPVSFTAEHICNKEHLIIILGFILTIAERLGWSHDPSSLLDVSRSSPSPSPSPTPPSPSSSPSPTPLSDSAVQKAIPTQVSHNPHPNPLTLHSTPTVPHTFQSTPAGTRSIASNGTPTLKSVFDDLIISEKEFLQDMELFFKLYVGPAKGALPSEKVNNIFGNLENLVSANSRFLVELQMVLDGFMNVATVWDNFAVAINIYSVYCIFQQHAHSIVEQCRREYPAFDHHLRSLENAPESKNINIVNFLVKPFSRVVKYNSVLKQLLQIVAVGSEDHQSLANVKKQFQDLHDTTNDTWKKVENARKISEIAGKLMGAEKAGLRKPGRIYIREGDFVVNGKPMKLFLFSDIIMYAAPVKAILKKSGGKTHVFKSIIQLNACTFQDLPDGKDGKNLMELVTPAKSYKIQASSPSDKRLWVTDIKKSIAKLSGDASTSKDALGPRPMLDLGRRGPTGIPVRQDSQSQMDKSTVIEETDEVQLGFQSPGRRLTEEDRRKTIKLEFGVPQRQLTIQDRSGTVDLNFKPREPEDSYESDEQLLVDKQKTEPRDVELEGSEEADQSYGAAIRVESEVEEHEATQPGNDTEPILPVTAQENGAESLRDSEGAEAVEDLVEDFVEDIEEQNGDILSSDLNPSVTTEETSHTEDYAPAAQVHEIVHEVPENNANGHAHSHAHNHQEPHHTHGHEHHQVHHHVHYQEPHHATDGAQGHTNGSAAHSEIDTNAHAGNHIESNIEDAESATLGAHEGHLNGRSTSSTNDTAIMTMQEEINKLKEELKIAHALAQTTAQELAKEQEDTKVWKARVERILAVLLDTAKQNTASG